MPPGIQSNPLITAGAQSYVVAGNELLTTLTEQRTEREWELMRRRWQRQSSPREWARYFDPVELGLVFRGARLPVITQVDKDNFRRLRPRMSSSNLVVSLGRALLEYGEKTLDIESEYDPRAAFGIYYGPGNPSNFSGILPVEFVWCVDELRSAFPNYFCHQFRELKDEEYYKAEIEGQEEWCARLRPFEDVPPRLETPYDQMTIVAKSNMICLAAEVYALRHLLVTLELARLDQLVGDEQVQRVIIATNSTDLVDFHRRIERRIRQSDGARPGCDTLFDMWMWDSIIMMRNLDGMGVRINFWEVDLMDNLEAHSLALQATDVVDEGEESLFDDDYWDTLTDSIESMAVET